jgi:signal peptidase II
MQSTFKKIFPYLLGALLLLLDQVVKWWTLKYYSFVLINKDYLFGLGQSWQIILYLVIISVLVLILITAKKTNYHYAFTLMIAGAVSNLIDRIIRGGVVDNLKFGSLSFNLADILLISGVIVYVWQTRKENHN